MTLLSDNAPCQSTGSGLLDALNTTETPVGTNALLSCFIGNGLGLHYIEIPALKSTPIASKRTADMTELRTFTARDTEIAQKPKRDTRQENKRVFEGESSRSQAVARLSSIIQTDRNKTDRNITDRMKLKLELLTPTQLV